jgi:hypothetical protein
VTTDPAIVAVDRKADAAHRRIDNVDRRVIHLEAAFNAHNQQFLEVARDVKELMKTVYKGSMAGGAIGGGGALAAYIMWQAMGGA